jgi:hypothetical protein
MQTDRGRLIRSKKTGAQKNSGMLNAFSPLSTATQTRLKFGRGLRRRGLTNASARPLLPPRGPYVIDRGRFIFYADSVACTGKG